jgi:hypothetical protein
MWLLVIAIFGLIVPNGYFIYWLVHDYNGIAPVLENRLAIAFILDAFITLGLLTVHFAHHPPGRYRWPWFVAFSIAGGLCFGLPFYWWINGRGRST